MKLPQVIAILCVSALSAVSANCCLPILLHTIIVTHPGASLHISIASGTLSMMSPFFIIAMPILGLYADRYSRRTIIIFCMILTMFGNMICFLGLSFNLKYYLLFGAMVSGATSCLPFLQAIIADFTPIGNTTLLIAWLGLAVMLGPTNSVILHWILDQYYFLSHYGYQELLILSLGFQLINLFIIFTFFPKERSLLEHEKRATYINQYLFHAFNLLFNRKALETLFLLLLFCFSWGAYYQHTSVYFSGKKLVPDNILFFNFFIQIITSILAAVVILPIALRIRCKPVILLNYGFLCMMLSSALILLYYYSWNPIFSAMSCLFGAISESFVVPLLFSRLLDLARPFHVGFIMSISLVFWLVAWSLGGLFAFAYTYEHYEILWGTVFIVISMALLFSYYTRGDLFEPIA